MCSCGRGQAATAAGGETKEDESAAAAAAAAGVGYSVQTIKDCPHVAAIAAPSVVRNNATLVVESQRALWSLPRHSRGPAYLDTFGDIWEQCRRLVEWVEWGGVAVAVRGAGAGSPLPFTGRR